MTINNHSKPFVHYLTTITLSDAGVSQSVRTVVRQLLPTGTVIPKLAAGQRRLHPKALQRKLSHEGLTFGRIGRSTFAAWPASGTCATRTSRCLT